MKTKEEIEQLAESEMLEFKKAMSKIGFGTYQEPFLKVIKEWYVDGYTQCQKDMADKKYTEEDLRKAISEAQRSWVVFPNHNSFEDAQVEFMYNAEEIIDLFINSLNKQDI